MSDSEKLSPENTSRRAFLLGLVGGGVVLGAATTVAAYLGAYDELIRDAVSSEALTSNSIG